MVDLYQGVGGWGEGNRGWVFSFSFCFFIVLLSVALSYLMSLFLGN